MNEATTDHERETSVLCFRHDAAVEDMHHELGFISAVSSRIALEYIYAKSEILHRVLLRMIGPNIKVFFIVSQG